MKNKSLGALTAGLCAITLLLSGCANDKKILKSTKAESTVIGSVGGFDVPMEIYRYVALNYRADYENGDPDVWLGESGQALLVELNADVDRTVTNLYTTLAMCRDYGINADDAYIADSVDRAMETIYDNAGRNYRSYLEGLAEYNMNDAVYRFFVRNNILAEELVSKMTEKGELPDPADMDAFRAVAESDEFVRVKQILIAFGEERTDDEVRAEAEKIKKKLDAGVDYEKLLSDEGEDVFMFSNPDGYYLSRGSYYEEFEDAAFSLDVGETSGVIETPAGCSIIRRYEKEEDYIDDNLDEMFVTYRDGLYNLALEAKNEELSVEWNEKAEKYNIFTLKASE